MAFPPPVPSHQKSFECRNMQEKLLVERGLVFINDPRKRRKCPVCGQNMLLFPVNYEEKVLLCENTYCEYPFGYEPLQIVMDESELVETPVQATTEFYMYPTKKGNKPLSHTTDSILGAPTGSVSSISELDRSSQIGDGDELLSLEKQDVFTAKLARQELRRKKAEQAKKEIQARLNALKKNSDKIAKLDAYPEINGEVIRNPKWLKNLEAWENSTGRKTLKKREKPQIENQLTISISATNETGANLGVNIQLFNTKS